MPNVVDLDPIVVTGPGAGGSANPFLSIWLMMDRAIQQPAEVIFTLPLFGSVDGHSIVVEWEGQQPPPKPSLVQTQITLLRDGFVRVGQAISALNDNTQYKFGPINISGAALKAAYFSLTAIILTDSIFRPGYGGENHGDTLNISLDTAAYYNSTGIGGQNFLWLHEAVHNTVPGRALVQQMFDRHMAAGGTRENYGYPASDFLTQETMTHSLARQIANQTGINIQPSGSNASNFPPYGYYSGTELDPPP